MNVHDIFPSKWISPEDLGSRRFEVTISGAALEDVFNRTTNEKEKRLVLGFTEAKKRLILNKTQAFAIAEIVGSPKTEDWIGKRIALRAGQARNKKATIVVEAPAAAPAAGQ